MAINLQRLQFSAIDLRDQFFDSLKQDYSEFSDWFIRKRDNYAYVFFGNDGNLDGFLYLKEEHEELRDIVPARPQARRIKVGTFKVNPHGTRLGERFLKKIFDHALECRVSEIYVTIFERHAYLIQLFERYGFRYVANKISANGTERVYVRTLFQPTGDVINDYPLIPIRANRHFLLAVYPEWHTRLLPDSMLVGEDASIVQDVSHSNSIHKIYLAAMAGIEQLQQGDTLVIYRTGDGQGSAYYRSVVTSICVVESLVHISNFPTFADFHRYCASYSVFSEDELQQFYYRRRYPWVIRFTYNLALRRRPNRKALIEEVGLNAGAYWGFMPLTTQQLHRIFILAAEHESPIVYQA